MKYCAVIFVWCNKQTCMYWSNTVWCMLVAKPHLKSIGSWNFSTDSYHSYCSNSWKRNTWATMKETYWNFGRLLFGHRTGTVIIAKSKAITLHSWCFDELWYNYHLRLIITRWTIACKDESDYKNWCIHFAEVMFQNSSDVNMIVIWRMHRYGYNKVD